MSSSGNNYEGSDNRYVTTPGMLPGQDLHPAVKTLRMLARIDLLIGVGALVVFVYLLATFEPPPGASGITLGDWTRAMWAMLAIAILLPISSLMIFKAIVPSMNRAAAPGPYHHG